MWAPGNTYPFKKTPDICVEKGFALTDGSTSSSVATESSSSAVSEESIVDDEKTYKSPEECIFENTKQVSKLGNIP